MKKLIAILITALTLISCGQKSSVGVKISGAFAVAAGSFSGGAVLLATSIQDGKQVNYSIPMNNDEIIYEFPTGDWTFMTLGWDGSQAMTGAIFCDAKLGVNVSTNLDLEFNLKKLDADGDSVIDPIPAHPCTSLIAGDLTKIDYAKFCSENKDSSTDCSKTNNYIRDNVNMSIKYGLVNYAGAPPKSRASINIPNQPSYGSSCVTTDNISAVSNGQHTDIAKVNFTSFGQPIVPTRLLSGLRLPLAFSIYEDDSAQTSCEDQYFTGSALVGNSVGELMMGGSMNRHDISGSTFYYRLPSQQYEHTLIDNSGWNTTFTITNLGTKPIVLDTVLTGVAPGSSVIDLSTVTDYECTPNTDCTITFVGAIDSTSYIVTIKEIDNPSGAFTHQIHIANY